MIIVHGDVHFGREPVVAMVIVLLPYCRQFFPRVNFCQPKLVYMEAVHVIVERDAVRSSAVQLRYRDTTTRDNTVTNGNTTTLI